MQEQITEVIYYINGTLKNKWIAINIAWVFCLLGWFFVSIAPDKYESIAQVHVDSRSMLKPLLKGLTVQTDIRAYISILQQLMFTRANLEQIAELSGMNPSAKSEAEKLALIEGFRENIRISGGRDDIFKISYLGTDAHVAKAVVLAVLTVFSEQTQKQSVSDADTTLRFIEEQILEYETRLRNAEKTRENFKRVNLDLLLDQESGLGGRMINLKSKLDTARLSLNEAISKRNVLNVQMQEVLTSDDDWRVSGLPVQLSPEELKLEELRSRRDDLLLKYTEKYPEIIAINHSIEEIEKRRELKFKNNGNEKSIASVMVNPYVQELKKSLNEADADVASAQSRVSSLTKRLAKLQQSLNSRLTVESDMKAINRDYESIKNNYQMLITRREKALMSEKVSNRTNNLTFKIAEPPSLALEPSEPNRPLLFTVIMVLGIIIGYGVAFLIFFIKPSYMSVKQLRSSIGLPVLGGISFMDFNTDIENNNKISFALVIWSLFGVYFMLVAIQILQSYAT